MSGQTRGAKTSEFYVLAIVAVIAAVNLFWNVGIQNETINTAVSLLVMFGCAATYVICRTVVKKGR